MKAKSILTVALLACVAAIVYAAPSAKPADSKVIGDYVEARTASVFAGACHYNGEFVTVGKDAVMAWNFTAGTVDGVDITGVRVMAAVTSENNLGADGAIHKSELVFDPSVSARQVEVVKDLLTSKCGDQLGTIVSVRRTPIAFAHESNGYVVEAKDFASMAVQSMPDDTCCKQPAMVWYNPLSPTHSRKVGYTEYATYSGTIADPWSRTAENSAFYGAIGF